MKPESIYLVWNPSGAAPQKRHDTLQSAREEARRLATANPHYEFFVLRAVESVQYRTDPFVVRNFSKGKDESR